MMPPAAKYAIAALFVLLATSALAQGTNPNNAPAPTMPGILEGSPQEQAACAPDVHKFCRDEIPDTFAVLACLKRERAKIGKPCQQVLINHGQ
jgi:hypothetical protein